MRPAHPRVAERRNDHRPVTAVLVALIALVALVVLAGLLAATGAAGWASGPRHGRVGEGERRIPGGGRETPSRQQHAGGDQARPDPGRTGQPRQRS